MRNYMVNFDAAGEPGMPEQEFERLLDAMPRIAEVIKNFESGAMQQRAFDALVQSFGTVTTTGSQDTKPISVNTSVDPKVTDQINQASPSQEAEPSIISNPDARTSKTNGSRKRPRRQWTAERDIDFWPPGKKSFSDLVAEKLPTTMDQKNLIAVYWFEQEAEHEEINIGKILAAYKAVGWAEPRQADSRLRSTACREHWIDTSTMKAIKTTPGGRNMVQHRMPIKKVEK